MPTTITSLSRRQDHVSDLTHAETEPAASAPAGCARLSKESRAEYLCWAWHAGALEKEPAVFPAPWPTEASSVPGMLCGRRRSGGQQARGLSNVLPSTRERSTAIAPLADGSKVQLGESWVEDGRKPDCPGAVKKHLLPVNNMNF